MTAVYFSSSSLFKFCILTLLTTSFFGAAPGWGVPKSVTYIVQWWNLAQLYLKNIQKIYLNHVTHPLGSADISIFLTEISKFCDIKKYRYWLHFGKKFLILLIFLDPSKIVLINMVTILMMSEKRATPGLLKKVYFEIKVMTSYIEIIHPQ